MSDAASNGEAPPVDASTGVPAAPLQMVVHPRGVERLLLSLLQLVASIITCLLQVAPGVVVAALFAWMVMAGHEYWAAGPFLLLALTLTVARWAWGR